jgi:hypothetical protein
MKVIFWKNKKSFVSKLIRFWTNSPYSHCELLFSDGTRFGIDLNQKAKFYKNTDYDNWDVLEFEGGNEEVTRNSCNELVGCNYDLFGVIFCQIFPWGWEDPVKWFCSELCVDRLQVGSYPQVLGAKPYQKSPNKLYDILLAGGASKSSF